VHYCESLAAFPHRGIRRDDLSPGLRVTNHAGNAVIAFHPNRCTATVSILGVYYGGRNYEAARQTIGNFKPCSFAHCFAMSYPASACRITPVPGSFHNTRAMRLSAASVPSHTITTPECCE